MDREKYDGVADSLRNGQYEQARRQMADLNGFQRVAMLTYFAEELHDPELALEAAKAFFRGQGNEK